jgi:excisionase family DNA binding protein
MPDPDYASWLTKDQAADAIGVTTKTIERLAQDSKIQQARWRRPTGGPELAVYHPDDVARIASERRQGPLPAFVVPAAPNRPANGNGNGNGSGTHALERVPAAVLPGDDLLRILVTAAVKFMSETSQTSALFVSIPEAATLSGLSKACIRRLIATGKLQAIRDRSWRIRRRDLEQL